MRLFLNIGHAVSGILNALTSEHVARVLQFSGFTILSSELADSETEGLTSIIECDAPYDFEAALYRASALLSQDCIAAWDTVTGAGALVGPQVDEWANFDLECFVFPAQYSAAPDFSL